MRMSYKKGKDVKKKSAFGMLSVKAGIDKTPNPTQADRIAGAKMGNRQKAMGGGMMVQGAVKKIKKLMDESKAKKQDKARVKKMGGGMMMGRRFGMKKGMSVKGDDKRDIRKTESMIGASKSSKREKGKTKFRMLSVKAGIDKNPNPTLADRIAGAKMKKRMQAKGGTNPFLKKKEDPKNMRPRDMKDPVRDRVKQPLKSISDLQSLGQG